MCVFSPQYTRPCTFSETTPWTPGAEPLLELSWKPETAPLKQGRASVLGCVLVGLARIRDWRGSCQALLPASDFAGTTLPRGPLCLCPRAHRTCCPRQVLSDSHGFVGPCAYSLLTLFYSVPFYLFVCLFVYFNIYLFVETEGDRARAGEGRI